MTAKEELRSLWLLELKVNLLCDEVDKLEAQVNRVNRWADSDPVQGGKAGREDILATLSDLRTDANRAIDNLVDRKQTVMANIDRIDDPLLAEILLERYIGCKSWADIAVNVHCSERNIYRLHGKALEAYSECSPVPYN